LRIDTIPQGAYIVPWMRPSLSFDEITSMTCYDIDAVMTGALKLNMTFTINIINGTRVVPSTVYLSHDKNYLYVGGKFRGMYENPTTTVKRTLSNYFNIYFDVANDGILTFPESGSMLGVYVNPGACWRTEFAWNYEDLVWSQSRTLPHSVWLMGYSYYSPNAQPAFAIGNYFDALYDNSTGTVIILYSKYLCNPATSEINMLQMRQGERWVMGFLIEIGYDRSGEYVDFVDGWPHKIYPYSSNDASTWPKLVIDLTNPPPGFT